MKAGHVLNFCKNFILVCFQVINAVSRVSPQITAPIVLFTYYNIIMRRGPQKFCQEIKAAGAAGVMLAPSALLHSLHEAFKHDKME